MKEFAAILNVNEREMQLLFMKIDVNSDGKVLSAPRICKVKPAFE